MSNTKTIHNALNLSNVKSWKQTIVAIGIICVNLIFVIKPETAVYTTIITLGFLLLMGFIVYMTTRNNKEVTLATKLSGHFDGLTSLLRDIEIRRNLPHPLRERECFDRMIAEINIKLNSYRLLLQHN